MKQLTFKGQGEEYFKIWIVNILLCIVTLGIYYPWAKVRTRRYFYANTEYADRFFDYHATGKQLFLGYLIGVAILLVFGIISTVLPGAEFILYIVLFLFIPWIIWRSLHFNMRMTSFSNVRFSFAGDLKTSYIVYMLIPILGYLGCLILLFASLSIPTYIDGNFDSSGLMIFASLLALAGSVAAIALGIYVFGIFKKKVVEYHIGQTKFGQGRFLVAVEAGKFITIALKSFLISFSALLALGLIFVILMVVVGVSGIDLDNMSDLAATGLGAGFVVVAMILYFGFIAASLFAAAYSYSRQRQYIFANTTLDNSITFKSTVGAKGYFSVLFTNMLLTIFTFGLAMPWAKVRVARYVAENTWIEAKDIDINSYLTQKEAEQSAIGEEIGDVLDVDVDIAI